MIACFVAASVAASAIPGLPEILEYDRAAVSRGQVWRVATGQLVHWGFAMAALDLAVVAIAGASLELRSRRIAGLTLALALPIIGLAVQLGVPWLERYRGSSGVGSALVAALVIDVIRNERDAIRRAIAAGIGVVFVAKLAWELATGSALPLGHLPSGIAVVPQAHLAGALSGLAAAVLGCRRR